MAPASERNQTSATASDINSSSKTTNEINTTSKAMHATTAHATTDANFHSEEVTSGEVQSEIDDQYSSPPSSPYTLPEPTPELIAEVQDDMDLLHNRGRHHNKTITCMVITNQLPGPEGWNDFLIRKDRAARDMPRDVEGIKREVFGQDKWGMIFRPKEPAIHVNEPCPPPNCHSHPPSNPNGGCPPVPTFVADDMPPGALDIPTPVHEVPNNVDETRHSFNLGQCTCTPVGSARAHEPLTDGVDNNHEQPAQGSAEEPAEADKTE